MSVKDLMMIATAPTVPRSTTVFSTTKSDSELVSFKYSSLPLNSNGASADSAPTSNVSSLEIRMASVRMVYIHRFMNALNSWLAEFQESMTTFATQTAQSIMKDDNDHSSR